MNCLNANSETMAVHGGAGSPLPVRANLFPVTGRDALGGLSASRNVFVSVHGVTYDG